MMFGSSFMFGFGLLAMLLVIGLPIALIVLLVRVLTRGGNSSAPTLFSVPQKTAPGQFCSHCGTALQAGWSHCPQCGAQV